MNTAPVGKDFILGGRAIFTLVGKVGRFTLKVRRADATAEDPNPKTFFVSVMTGTNNESYDYMGVLEKFSGQIIRTKGSKVPANHPAFVAASWALPQIWKHGKMPGGQVVHAGRCGRCAKLLTDPDSVRTGFGPECRGKLGIPITRAEDVAAGGDL